MTRKIEVDLFEIIDIWYSMEDMGVHEEDLTQFIPKDITPEEVDDYCKTYMPLKNGYTKEDDWTAFKDKIQELMIVWDEQ